MAENEILDLASRSWKRALAVLAMPEVSMTGIAQCVADELESKLTKTLRKGLTLWTVIHAIDDPAALRAAVKNFQDQTLARIASNAARFCSSEDPAVVASHVATRLLEGVKNQTTVFANSSIRFEDADQRHELATALQREFDSRHQSLAAVIEASLRGYQVPPAPKGAKRLRAPVDASALVRSPLVISTKGRQHAQEHR